MLRQGPKRYGRAVAEPTRADPAPPPGGRRIRGLDAEQRKAKRRAQLLEATLDLVAANGYPNTSIEQICQAAYVGTKGFYEIFENKEACYIALIQEVSERIETAMAETLRDAPDDEPGASRTLLAAFAHALADDPRLAKVTFGEASGISSAVERQRRINRRWAADFLLAVWGRFGMAPAEDARPVAVGAIGGLFDLVADWMVTDDPDDAGDVDALIAALTAYYQVIRDGLRARSA